MTRYAWRPAIAAMAQALMSSLALVRGVVRGAGQGPSAGSRAGQQIGRPAGGAVGGAAGAVGGDGAGASKASSPPPGHPGGARAMRQHPQGAIIRTKALTHSFHAATMPGHNQCSRRTRPPQGQVCGRARALSRRLRRRIDQSSLKTKDVREPFPIRMGRKRLPCALHPPAPQLARP